MSDNIDLLGGDLSTAAAAPAPPAPPAARKPGRPRKNPVIVAIDPATPGGDMSATVTAEVLPDGVLNILDVQHSDPLVPASTKGAANAEAEASRDVSDIVDTVGDGFTGYRPAAEADGSVSLELPPVSPEYAAAQARRPIIIGQTTRSYAYQRVLRAGKKL